MASTAAARPPHSKSSTWNFFVARCAIDYHAVRRATFRAAIAELKRVSGCDRCGYDRCAAALSFHHEDPSSKSFSVANVGGRSWDSILQEIEKCVILCANCHHEVEEGLRQEGQAQARRVDPQLELPL